MVKRLLISVILGLLVFACYLPQEFDLDESFKLEYRATKTNSDENIKIRFEGVVIDERCPVEYDCLVPGNAQVALNFWKGTQKEDFTLNTWAEPRVQVVMGYKIELLGLAPPNSVDNPPSRRDYVVTLMVSKIGDECLRNADCISTGTQTDTYCQKEDGQCDALGRCEVRPDACPRNLDPVCGCDGRTYSNACMAAANGINVDYRGECKPQYCWSNKECAADEYCFFEVCALETGVCQRRPEQSECPRLWDPVCGCDGQTYANSCTIAVQGVSIDYAGECKEARDTHCDDGTTLACKMMVPTCAEYEILAYQNSCYVCVNPVTCLPWGQANCKTDDNCAPEEYCNMCATSSCPFCDDCVAACMLKRE